LPRNSTGTGTTADSPRCPPGPLTFPGKDYRGRFAPSPTGPLHFGSLLAAAASWLDARAAGGEWLVRIEDLDPPREPPGAAADILRTLEAFGLWWDREVLYQSRRQAAYDAALAQLAAAGQTYECVCSRAEIEAANMRLGREGARIYPGTCRTRPAKASGAPAIRLRTTSERIGFRDRLQGEYARALETDSGDFVLRRREGFIAYQLAVVVDDGAQGITDVVRGVDLLDSTPRQLWLQRLLGYPTPRYMHFPVVVQPGGEKLSKQTGAAAVTPRDARAIAWQVLALMGQAPPAELRGAPPPDLWDWGVAHWDPQQISATRNFPAP
jgi:glutamyl-Q tRNA(Asp) synthetase